MGIIQRQLKQGNARWSSARMTNWHGPVCRFFTSGITRSKKPKPLEPRPEFYPGAARLFARILKKQNLLEMSQGYPCPFMEVLLFRDSVARSRRGGSTAAFTRSLTLRLAKSEARMR